jgi:hypothetical protein
MKYKVSLAQSDDKTHDEKQAELKVRTNVIQEMETNYIKEVIPLLLVLIARMALPLGVAM